MTAIFVCIVQPKVIEFNVTDQKLHRAQKDEELRSELESLKLPPTDQDAADFEFAGKAAEVLCQPGGGCRLMSRSPSVSVASVGSAVCVFEGSLANAVALAEDYAPLPEDEPTPEPSALSSAQLVCHMYAKVGVETLGLLRGSFTFVLYESKTSRVLAARGGSGQRTELFQARSAKGSLVLTNSGELLEACGCTEKLEFQPGDYKYGWSATPRRYQPADHVRLSRRSLDLPASAHHHHHHHPQGNLISGNSQGPKLQGALGGSRNGSRRTSLDSPAPAAPSTAGCPETNGGGGGRHHNRNNHHAHQQQQTNGRVGSPQRPSHQQQQQAAAHPHRTYAVSAEDPRILKSHPTGPLDPQPAAAPKPAPAAAAGTAATWTAVAVAASPAAGGHHLLPARDKARGHGQEVVGNGRGSSARGVSSEGHSRRRSMDNHGAWKLGSGQNGVSAANRQLANGQEHMQTPPSQQQQQHSATSNGGKPRGRQSAEGRTPGKPQQQQQVSSPAAKPALVRPSAAVKPPCTALRVDAPEFVCTRAATAAGSSAPTVVAAVVGAVEI